MNILGISAYYHDSAAVLVRDGRIVAAAQEERFTRIKHDDNFPRQAVKFCLEQGGVAPDGLDAVAFYDKPVSKFVRILETYMSVAPRGLKPYLTALPVWMKQKLWIPVDIESSLERLGIRMPGKIYFPEHHESHAASAFYPSPFEDAAVLTIDGVGVGACSTVGMGRGADLDILEEMRFPHSLGLLYSAFTYFCGFRVNSGEYKLMGLAPYGRPKYKELILDRLMDLKEDGSFRLNMEYFGYLDGMRMTSGRFDELFGGGPRAPESEITDREKDLARSIQEVTEEIVLRMARHAQRLTGAKNLCLAGGVALNCVANGRLLREGPFEDIWIQPAAGDAGGALGAALLAWHKIHKQPRVVVPGRDAMQGGFLGPDFSDEEVGAFLAAHGYVGTRHERGPWAEEIAKAMAAEQVVGLCQGRMEFGPRALGGRSIIGDARSEKMQSVMNLKIKYRESFRPFAPACLEERVGEYFELDRPSPYMLLVAPVKKERRTPEPAEAAATMRDQIHRRRSDIPAITHVDYSARIQTVTAESNPGFHAILKAFEALTGYGIVINTSFNVRGEPIVCTPEDAYRCFMRTDMDLLVLGSWILKKADQPPWLDKADWRLEYKLD